MLKSDKSFDGGVAGRGVLAYYNKRLSIIRGGGGDDDDAIVIFGAKKSGVFWRSIYYNQNEDTQKF